MIVVICTDCGIDVLAQRSSKKYCSPCAQARERESKRQHERTDAAKTNHKRWLASDAGRAYRRTWDASHVKEACERAAKWRAKPENKLKIAEAQRIKNRTPEGRAYRCAATQRRTQGVAVENYKRLALEVARGVARCYSCGDTAEQVDHVLPIALAREVGLLDDVDHYVAPICRPCHTEKTKHDIRDIRSVRAAVAA